VFAIALLFGKATAEDPQRDCLRPLPSNDRVTAFLRKLVLFWE
jgi:hypothetical protein